MLIFNEGLPGAGKSYDAVAVHILPALKAGRQVFARLNGLDHEKIAAYLGEPVENIRQLLVLVPDEDVPDLPKIAARDSLIVIDEAHKYYVASREAMAKGQETFFAEHRHDGQDILIISQWYRRLHSAVRARIERKQLFQKLTAVGLENSYRVTYYHATEPERFEKVSAENKKYDAAIFALYEGIRPATKNTAVYKAGGQTVWRKIAGLAIWVVPLVLVAVFVFMKFFHGDAGMAKDAGKTRLGAAPAVVYQQPQGPAPVAAANLPGSQHAGIDTKGFSVEAAYLFDMSAQARPRLAALYSVEHGDSGGIIEWRQDQGHVLDRMTIAQVREMGVSVEVHTYGVKLAYKGKSIIVTAWPLDMPGTVADAGQNGQQATAQAVQSPAPGQGAESGTNWHRKPIAGAYTPPELVKGPGPSDWKG